MDSDKIILILSALLAVSEGLSLIPQLKANGILQLAIQILKAVLPKKPQA